MPTVGILNSRVKVARESLLCCQRVQSGETYSNSLDAKITALLHGDQHKRRHRSVRIISSYATLETHDNTLVQVHRPVLRGAR